MSASGRTRKWGIRRGDLVEAISGEDAESGKTGKVLRVFPAKGWALVEGFNYIKKHVKKNPDNPRGAIVQKESPMPMSKLKLHSRPETPQKA
jgi:large subunit ribosomal protein L24